MAETTITPNTTTTDAVFIDEKWDEWVIRFREKNLKAAPFFRRLDATVSESGDLIHIPKVTERSATTFTVGGSLYDDLDPQTETDIQLSVNTYTVSPFLIPDLVSQQAMYNRKAAEYQTSGYAIAKKLDTDVLADYSNYTNTAINSSGTTIDNKDITSAQVTLDEADVPEEDRMFFMHPRCRKDLLDLTGDYFTSIDFSSTKGLESGIVGYLVGSPTVFTTNVPTASVGSPSTSRYVNIYAHREATALGMQWTPQVQEQYKIERQGTLCNVRALYGIKTTRADHGVAIYRTVST
jgi:hypothetical protein